MSKQVLELARPARLVDLSRFNLSTRYKTTLLNEAWQNAVKRQFALPEHTRVVKTSLSVCPVCNRRIPMAVYEENGAIWLKKVCPEHGAFEDLYWGDAEMYYYFLQWDTPEYIAKGLANPYTDLQFYTEMGSCPMGCGLCPVHKSDTVLAIIDVTNRCNMACPVCFANAGAAGYVYEPTLEQIEYMLRTLRAQRPWPPNALQLSGGEPTLRDDLPEIVRMAKKLGFTHIEVNTKRHKAGQRARVLQGLAGRRDIHALSAVRHDRPGQRRRRETPPLQPQGIRRS
jgi:Predicted Fe-S oxidoreductases